MPQEVLAKWRKELAENQITDADFRRRVEYYLDQNYGSSYLRDKRIADVLQETLLEWDGVRYNLISWVIMPNHGHILMTPEPAYAVPDIMHSIKSFRLTRYWSDKASSGQKSISTATFATTSILRVR